MKIITSIFFLLLLSGSYSVEAQESPPPQKKLFEDYWQADDSLSVKIQFARKLINNQNYQGAADYLETLYETNPENAIIRNLLRQCYQSLGQYFKLEQLLRVILKDNPKDIGAQLALIDAVSKQNRPEEVKELFYEAIKIIPPNNSQLLRSLISTILNYELPELAHEFIAEYRQQHQDSIFFAIEMGRYYESRKEYKPAAAEYVKLLSDTTGLGIEAERQLAALLQFEDSSPMTKAYLISKSKDDTLGLIAGLLSNYFLSTDQHDKAFAYLIEQDSLSGFKGNRLISYMADCSGRKLYQPVITMGQYIEKKYQENLGIYHSAAFYYAGALTEHDQLAEAERIYNSIIKKTRSPRDIALALYGLGMLELEKKHDYPQALQLFDSVITAFPQGQGYQQALLAVPVCYLRQGKLDEAYTRYEKLRGLRMLDDLKEEALYQQAMIRLYQRQIDTAAAMFDRLLVTYPNGLFFNDAVQMSLTITEAKEYPHILNDYTRALYFEALGQTDSMKYQLEKVASNSVGILADLALYRMIQLNLSDADKPATLIHIAQLKERFPESYYIPFALKIEADLYLADKTTLEAGKKLYKYLLEQHPMSPFTDEIREKLRKLVAEEKETA